MRVLLVANYQNDGQESMQRFAALMHDSLTAAGHEVRIVRPPSVLGRRGRTLQGVGKWLGYVDKFLVFPPSLRREARWADVVHICDHSNSMYSSWAGHTPSIVTCHDMLAVRGALGEATDCPPSATGKYLQKWIIRGMERANGIACVSTATMMDVERILRPAKGATRLVMNALNHAYKRIPPEECERELNRLLPSHNQRPFVLHVGSNHPRKNKAGAIRAFAAAIESADLNLVLVGPALSDELRSLVTALGISDRVSVVVKPKNEDLQVLYNAALCLLFPSRFEGFGWPLIEAQACGCPVVCSRCGPFAEVVGESAIMCDADDEAGLAQALVKLASNPELRKTLVARGSENVKRFSPEAMINSYVNFYRELASRS